MSTRKLIFAKINPLKVCCVKCQDLNSENEELQNVTEKGAQQLIKYRIKIKDVIFEKHLTSDIPITIKIHRKCQKEIYNELKRKTPYADRVKTKVKRVETRGDIDSTFDWKENCFFCNLNCSVNTKHLNRSDCVRVFTLPFKENILDICTHKSENDEWMCAVRRRVLSCHDLVAVEARYHTKLRKVKYEQEQGKLNIPGATVRL